MRFFGINDKTVYKLATLDVVNHPNPEGAGLSQREQPELAPRQLLPVLAVGYERYSAQILTVG
jgi:hypothetical protein